MPGNYSITRTSDTELDTIDPSNYHVIGAIGRNDDLETVGDDPRSGAYVIVKPDKRLAPFVSRDRLAPDMTPNILLVEVDDPDDPETIGRLQERLGL